MTAAKTEATVITVGLDKVLESLTDQIEESLLTSGRVIADHMREIAPVAFGVTRDSIRDPAVVESNAEEIVVEVLVASDHARWANYGRGPGKAPPPEVMVRWVEHVMGLSGSEAESAAYLIGQKIAVRGTAPTNFLERAVDAHEQETLRALKDILE